MSNTEKCFCHLNGYKVKDADARAAVEILSGEVERLTTENANLSAEIEALKASAGGGGSKLYAHYITISVETDMCLTIKFVLYSYKSTAFETFTQFYNYMHVDNEKHCVNGRLFCEELGSYATIFIGIFDQMTIANNVVQVFATDLVEGLFSGYFNMADADIIALTDEFHEIK